jgi:hypothetical protein
MIMREDVLRTQECPCRMARELIMMGREHKRLVMALRLAQATVENEACLQECAALAEDLHVIALFLGARAREMAMKPRMVLSRN